MRQRSAVDGAARTRSSRRSLTGRVLAATGAAAVVLAWLALPDVPNYDTASHLVWARELLAGHPPGIDAPAAPTLHPLWLATAAVANLTGLGAPMMQLVALAGLAVTAALAGALAGQLAGARAAVVAALLVASSSIAWHAILAIEYGGPLALAAGGATSLGRIDRRRRERAPGGYSSSGSP